jgi:hypothetical protein
MSSLDSPGSNIRDRNTFEKRRRTHNNTVGLQNDATDQKIPSIIRPIPDETEEFNLKGSISVETNKDRDRDYDNKGIRSGERILVQHNGDKTNLRDRV